ncbi:MULTISPECIES: immunity 51 family protein [unclassified Ruminococcus]|uniref:immunity 51 family protein n=1 Tax=unclassified Ruminococcus TaxID=2608920 RepID=UPI00210B1101|nr:MULTISPECIES: immunity 51 family protein [unclassified Ruminococcus]MCQ4022421.1 hypothetical protein [Ruminococcus sp. zg-924]MCQ4114749.1 hypothetical protein [Ruminococcus sp. zg-921]
MNIRQRIDKFNQESPPFYIVDHEDGSYSLCLPLDMLGDEYYPYCQDAFDAYAAEIGEPAYSKNGLKTHGSGYEWEAAFREAFKDDPNISKILFDCEMGGFFCYANDLTLLEDFGSRFKDICEDTEGFIPIVSAGIKNAEAWEAEQEALMRTVKGQLMQKPSAIFDIMTPDGNVRLTPEDSKELLDGSRQFITINGVIHASYELLNQEITDMQTDLFDQNLVRLKTEEPEETMTMSM